MVSLWAVWGPELGTHVPQKHVDTQISAASQNRLLSDARSSVHVGGCVLRLEPPFRRCHLRSPREESREGPGRPVSARSGPGGWWHVHSLLSAQGCQDTPDTPRKQRVGPQGHDGDGESAQGHRGCGTFLLPDTKAVGDGLRQGLIQRNPYVKYELKT